MDSNKLELCVMHSVPFSEGTCDFSRVYSFNVNEVPVELIFEKYLRNRGGREDAIQRHIKELADAMIKVGSMAKMPPITVDINTMQIVDGNCRFQAMLMAKEYVNGLVLRVIFEDIDENEFDDRVMELNMGHKSWSTTDIIYNYSLRGVESFTKFIAFCKDTETLHDAKDINPRYGAAALGIPTSHLKSKVLTITDDEIMKGIACVNEAREIRSRLPIINKGGGGWYEPFLRAWYEVRKKMVEKGIPFKDYLKEFNFSLKNRKKVFKVPFGSNQRSEWETCLNSIFAYL